jgi:lysine-specific demethylase 8
VSAAAYPEIERLAPPSRRDFQRHFQRRSRPAVFVGAMEHWPALAKWTPAYFRERYGHLKVPIQVRERLTGDTTGVIDEEYREMTFGDYLDSTLLGGKGTSYAAQYNLFAQVPELARDVAFPEYWRLRLKIILNVWVGPGGTNSKFHYDQDQNLFAQVYGRKRVILAAPRFSERLYPINKSWGDAYSPIDPSRPDLEKYPRFAEVECLESVLGPGDMLYIPLRWWHDVTALEGSISVNLWWWTPTLFLRNVACREWERFSRGLRGERQAVYGAAAEPASARRRP